MQFIEKNSFNLRAVVYSLKKDDTALEAMLDPTLPRFGSDLPPETKCRLFS